MAKGKIGRVARKKAKRAYRAGLRMPKRKLAKYYGTVSGKLVAVTALKNKRKSRRSKRPMRRMRRSRRSRRY